jgi:hypothetical protein
MLDALLIKSIKHLELGALLHTFDAPPCLEKKHCKSVALTCTSGQVFWNTVVLGSFGAGMWQKDNIDPA